MVLRGEGIGIGKLSNILESFLRRQNLMHFKCMAFYCKKGGRKREKSSKLESKKTITDSRGQK